MYKFLWSKLPGGDVAKFLQTLTALIAIMFVLFQYVFPVVENWYLGTGAV